MIEPADRGPFLEELAEFLALFRTTLDALTRSSERVQQLLRSGDTRFYLVTTPTAGRLDEAIAFRSELQRRGFPMGGCVLNRMHHPIANRGQDDAYAAMAALDLPAVAGLDATARHALVAGLSTVIAEHNVLAARDAQLATRLAEVTERPPVQVPRFPLGVHDLDGLGAVGQALIAEGT